MGMFDTTGREDAAATRSANTLRKLERMNRALRHEEPDRVPISDFFWGSFIKRWRTELGLPDDADPYYYYDLDWIVTVPNMDPQIRSFEMLRETHEEVVVKTGYGAIMRKKFDFPMPEFIGWETDTLEKLEAFAFDDPYDPRRYFAAGDNQIAGVGDGFERNSPALDRDGQMTARRLPGLRQHDRMCRVSDADDRPGKHDAVDRPVSGADGRSDQPDRRSSTWTACKAQIAAADGLLDGMVIWGDVAYRRSMFFSPDYWRTYFRPGSPQWCASATRMGLPVIYHGCGNVELIFEDFIEIGVDSYNPLEAKAGLDCVALRQALRPSLRRVRQQQHPGLGDRRQGRDPPRGADQAQRGQGRRHDFPVGSLRDQQCVGPDV